MKKLSSKARYSSKLPKLNIEDTCESKKMRKHSAKEGGVVPPGNVKIQITEPVADDSKLSQNHKKVKKLSSVERNQERYIKQSVTTFAGADFNNYGQSNWTLDTKPSSNVDAPNRFKTLNYYIPVPDKHQGKGDRTLAKRQISSPRLEECPQDRVEFYKTFSLLINIGSSGKKRADSKPDTKYANQSVQDVAQARWVELLWLALKAWLANRTMEEQDVYLWERRQKVHQILEQIRNFCIPVMPVRPKPKAASAAVGAEVTMQSAPQPPMTVHSSTTHSSTFNEIEAVSGCNAESRCEDELKIHFATQDYSVNMQPARIGSRKRESLTLDFTNSNAEDHGNAPNSSTIKSSLSVKLFTPCNLISPDDISQQHEALMHVTSVMNKLEAVESLYPNLKALKKEHPIYASDEFQTRIDAMCLWLNITTDMSQKLQVMAKVLGVDEIENLNWPGVDSHHSKVLQENNQEDLALFENPLKPSTCGAEEVFSETPIESSTPLKTRSKSSYSGRNSLPSVSDMGEVGTWIYRQFVDKSLKQMGLRKMIERLRDLLDGTLQRAKHVLQYPHTADDGKEEEVQYSKLDETNSQKHSPSTYVSPEEGELRHHNALSLFEEHMASVERRNSLTSYGTYSQHFKAMRLPSFRPTYLFLVRIAVDVMHECLKLRLENKPAAEPSLMSIKQLISECKEVITGSILIKQYHQRMIGAVLWDARQLQEKIENDLDDFEKDLRDMLEVYFDYLHSWIQMLQRLPQASLSLKNIIQEEWSFVKEMCPHIRDGEAQAGQRFCVMASGLLTSTSEFLSNKMDEQCSQLQDSTSFDETRTTTLRESSRTFKEIFHEIRERASKALGFAKLLRKDLEIAAEFQTSTGISVNDLLAMLKTTNHIKVLTSHSSDYLLFIPKHLKDNQRYILQLLNVTCGNEDISSTKADCEVDDGYMLLIRPDISALELSPAWDGETVQVYPSVETTIALADVEVNGLLLVVNHSSQLQIQRKHFSKLMGDKISLISEQTSSHRGIAEALEELKSDALTLCATIKNAIYQIDEIMNSESLADIDEVERINKRDSDYYKETMHRGFNLGFEYHKEVSRLVTDEAWQKLGKELLDFATKWMKFVLDKCERGRGTRPRWANQGLDFLIVACEPRNLSQLSEEDFQNLKRMMNECISHVIGTQDKTPGSPAGYHTKSPADFASPRAMNRPLSWPSSLSTVNRSLSHVSTVSEPSSVPAASNHQDCTKPDIDSNLLGHGEENQETISKIPPAEMVCADFRSLESVSDEVMVKGDRLKKVRKALDETEEERDRRLHEHRVIGKVLDKTANPETINISCKKVPFRWQRGFKIGEGQTGTTVYSCINMDTGETIAMKAIRFMRNDHSMIKDIADEIKNFESLKHPSLVRYYGAEVHRDELLVFMEYCDEGTLAEAARQGLPEHLIRRYTYEITTAINVLHGSGIVHRDIKGANIFLSSDGHVKLGDFGSSIKLKSQSTMRCEVNAFVGTAAYMAPEVITQADKSGYGRAADIWSLGCIIIEMATGKGPWHEFDHNYAIIYKVGEGATPNIPETLSSEGQEFVSHCLQHDLNKRWTASQLLDHAFLKVSSDGED
ncbi:mitogen-activated protein kinase kinase kinase 4-like isoform X2 [Ptychodera flava]